MPNCSATYLIPQYKRGISACLLSARCTFVLSGQSTLTAPSQKLFAYGTGPNLAFRSQALGRSLVAHGIVVIRTVSRQKLAGIKPGRT